MDLITLASWPSAEWTFSFAPAARRELLDANKGFDTESQLAELAFWVTIELETEWVPAKSRHAELADLVQAAEQPAAALATLHTENRRALLLTAYRAGKTGMWLRQIEQELGVLSSIARDTQDGIPARGGRPPLLVRKGLIRWTCGWVERLPPLPSRAAVQVAISRDAEKDRVHLSLVAPQDDLEQRCVESVKIVLREVGLDGGPNVRAIVRKVLAKKPI